MPYCLFSPLTLYFSTWKTNVEVPINKALFWKKGNRKSIVMLSELLIDQQGMTVAVSVCNRGRNKAQLMFCGENSFFVVVLVNKKKKCL